MAVKATRDEALYLQARGLRVTAPKALNQALRLALEDMQTTLYGEAEEEQPGRDPLADTAVKAIAGKSHTRLR